MRPKQPGTPKEDLLRSSLEAILDPGHELIRLAGLIDWERFDDAFRAYYHDRKGRRGLPTRLMAGLHLLKHMKGLADEDRKQGHFRIGQAWGGATVGTATLAGCVI